MLIPSGSFAVAGVLLVIGLLILILRFAAPGALTALAKPFWQLGNMSTNGMHSFASLFGNSAQLTRERDTLAQENLALAERARTLEARSADLERLVGTRTASANRVLAGVLARPPVTAYDSLILDAGSVAGVHVGDVAYAAGGVPLGAVDSVLASSAHVALYSSGGQKTEGWVGDTRIPITLTGKGGGTFDATLPRESGVAVNAVVYIPGPGALPIGTVVRIDSNPSSPRDTIHIAPYVNIFSLTWVEVAAP
ncbi:MAG: Rod shape-determining protein MreC [Parcubacteria group bacterium]|nr:Rod shape-determining protein MreC [Parcubacteria group bacterium]